MPSNQPTNRQREAARRALQAQAADRRRRAAQRKRANVVAAAVGAVVVVAVVVVLIVVNRGGGDQAAGSSAATSAAPSSVAPSSSSAAAQAVYPCTWTKTSESSGSKKANVPSTTSPPKTGTATLDVSTNRGAMSFSIDRADAPCAAASTISLAMQRFYDGTSCHRLVTQGIYVLQCGDPTGTGAGGPGYAINDEATGNETYPAGTIAMARTSEANSTGSQFFIVYQDSPSLQQQLGAKQYDVIGRVTSGLSVVQTVAKGGAATGTDGKPKLSLTFSKITVAS